MKKELRCSATEFRAVGTPAKPKIEGYAATFNTVTILSNGVSEVIRPGAFKNTVANNELDCACYFDHETSLILGRVSAGTLRLKEDDKGLFFSCDIDPEITYAMDVYRNVRAGNLKGCSFGFYVLRDNITKDKKGNLLCELLEVSVFDVGPVSRPQYADDSQTSVVARSTDASRAEAARRAGAGKPVPFAPCSASLRDADFDQEDAISGMVNWAMDDEDRSSGKKFNPAKLAQGFAYVDGDGSEISDYKLPHHSVKDGKLVHSLAGTTRAMSDLVSGAVAIPAQHRVAVTNHLLDEFGVFGEQDVTNDDSDLERSRRSAAVAIAKLKFYA